MDSTRPTAPSLAAAPSNRTLCGDDLAGTAVDHLYRWPPLRRFVADICAMPELHLLADPLACLNAMAYSDGESLGWHFDRAIFTTTLLAASARSAVAAFEYRRGLRSDDDPNHDGVARLLAGHDPDVCVVDPAPGTLTVFRGHAHAALRLPRSAVTGLRVVVVLAFADRPGVHAHRRRASGLLRTSCAPTDRLTAQASTNAVTPTISTMAPIACTDGVTRRCTADRM